MQQLRLGKVLVFISESRNPNWAVNDRDKPLPFRKPFITYLGRNNKRELTQILREVEFESYELRQAKRLPYKWEAKVYGLAWQNQLIATCEGSCNSWEKKYRHREQKPTCPNCEKSTIRKGESEYYCWKKIGGCGAKFPLNDEAIKSQKTGLIPNAEIFDQINTIQKMAQKRSLVGAVLIATGASEFFTQDLEDR